MSTAKPTWYILGAGAIGCLWASYWRQSGFNIVFITRAPRSSSQLTLISQENKTVVDISAMTIDELCQSDIKVQYLLICTKAQDTLSAMMSIEKSVSKQATLLVIQNGMAAKSIKQYFPTHKLLTGITNDGAYRRSQLSVVHAGHGITFIDADQYFIKTLLPSSGLTIKSCRDIEIKQWQKLAINCAMNGLTAIYQCRNGELLNKPEAIKRIKAICDELIAITHQLGISEHFQNLQQQVNETIHITANNYSSMYQDIKYGHKTEIGMLNGYVCEQAKKLGVSCDENQRIYDEVRQLESNG